MSDAWEWELPEGVKIVARVELPERIESVWIGGRLVSRSAAGGKKDGHAITLPQRESSEPSSDAYRIAQPPGDGVVTFASVPVTAMTCTLRLDGKDLSPTLVPDPPLMPAGAAIGLGADFEHRPAFEQPRRPRWPVVLGSIVLGTAGLIYVPKLVHDIRAGRFRAQITSAPAKTELTETATLADGSIAAHFPSDFVMKVAYDGAGFELQRKAKLETIILASTSNPPSDDARELADIVLDLMAASAADVNMTMSRVVTRTETCSGHLGALSRATFSSATDSYKLKLVACTTVRNGRGYFFAYQAPDFIDAQEEVALQRIVAATHIFDLPRPQAPIAESDNPLWGHQPARLRPAPVPAGRPVIFGPAGISQGSRAQRPPSAR